MNAERRSFIIVTERESFARWLSDVLHEEGEAIVIGGHSLERVIQAVDVTGARVVFTSLSDEGLREEKEFLEGMATAKPLLPVIAMAETPDQNLLLAALRAGTRDFITPELRPEEVANIVRRAVERPHAGNATPATENAWAAAVISARPGSDAPMFSLHLALAIQAMSPQNKVLLLDLGTPAADTLLFMGIKSPYTFVDAVRSLRRLDATLIETAFGKCPSGMHLLAMPDEPRPDIEDITSADVYVLLGTLRRHFTHIVINMGGVPPSDFLYLPLGLVDRTILIAEQSLPSCKQNMAMLQHLRENKIGLTHAGLVIDHYLSKMPPDIDSIAKGMGLPLLATLPSSGIARLAMMNMGGSMYDTSPRDPYALAVRRLAAKVVAGETAAAAGNAGWLARLRAKLSGRQ